MSKSLKVQKYICKLLDFKTKLILFYVYVELDNIFWLLSYLIYRIVLVYLWISCTRGEQFVFFIPIIYDLSKSIKFYHGKFTTLVKFRWIYEYIIYLDYLRIILEEMLKKEISFP